MNQQPVPMMRIVSQENDDHLRRLAHGVRVAEALLFASPVPLGAEDIARTMPGGVEVETVLTELERLYRPRGVNLERIAGKWLFRTAPDLGHLLRKDREAPKALSRAALETLSIIAYHQPATRAEIEEIRGVSTHRGTLDLLLDAGFIRMRGRRRTPGRPVTFGTTEAFLVHFGLERISDLPGLDDLQSMAQGEGKPPPGFVVPLPSDDPALRGDEDALEADIFDVMTEARLDVLAAEPPLDPEGQDASGVSSVPPRD